MYALMIDGIEATRIAEHSPPTYETLADGGCGELTTTLNLHTVRDHQALRPNAHVQLLLGGLPVYTGFVRDYDRDSGALVASGQGMRNKLALDAAGNATLNVGVAIAEAQRRGWQTKGGPGGVVAGEVGEPQTVGSLLSALAEDLACRWGVGGDGRIYMRPDPTSHRWLLLPGAATFGSTGEGQATMLVGRYLTESGTYGTVTVGDPSGDEEPVDLTDRGPLGTMQAAALLGGVYARWRPKVAWLGGVEVHQSQLTTIGGTSAALADVVAGQMIRVTGLPVYAAGGLWADVVIGKARYTAGSDTIYLEPVNAAPRSLADVLAAA